MEKIYPSHLNNLAACPGWLPEPYGEDDNEWSIEGTALHKAVELGKRDPESVNIQVTKGGEKLATTVVLDDDQRNLVNECLTLLDGLRKGNYKEQMEASLQIPELTEMYGMSRGKADALFLYEDTRHFVVVDWKFGRNKQTAAEDNLQGLFYALGAAAVSGYKRGIVLFVYPRLGLVDKATVRDLAPAAERITTTLDKVMAVRVKKDFSLLTPDSKNCQYCQRLSSCPKLNSNAIMLAANRAPDLIPTDWAHPSELTRPEDIGRALKAEKILSAWCQSVKNRARQMRFDEGIEIPGFEVTFRKGSRDIKDCAMAVSVLCEEFGCTINDLVPAIKKLSVPDIEGVLWNVEKTKPKEQRRKQKELKEEIQRVLSAEGVLVQGDEIQMLTEIKGGN